jgi:1-acyl-sn-glycerol-3-phosphate acyltransferase
MMYSFLYISIGCLCPKAVEAEAALVLRVFYKIFRHILFKIHLRGRDNITRRGPLILVSNHAGSFGPISVITSFPSKLYPWVDHETTDPRSAGKKVQVEFLEAELHLKPPLSEYLGRVIGRICAALMRDIEAIPVYDKSRRIWSTVDESLKLLQQGKNILVFPEDSLKPKNEVLCDFSTGFMHLAKYYFEKTRRAISFLPIAVNRKVKGIGVGKPIQFNERTPFQDEKARLKRELESSIFTLYRSLENDGDAQKVSGLR